jgi:cytochrome c556
MIRIVLATAVVALGVTAVVAQTDPIAARKALMKANGDNTKIAVAMMKGEAPFDLAKAQTAFATYQDAAKKMPDLFPDTSKTGGDTAALPAIWDHMDDVKARFQKLGDDATTAAAATKDLDSFKASFPAVTKNCGGCHETYRAKKS